jgi:RNA polymerase sigma-70 factor (ECF subfamily)
LPPWLDANEQHSPRPRIEKTSALHGKASLNDVSRFATIKMGIAGQHIGRAVTEEGCPWVRCPNKNSIGTGQLATEKELSDFLADVERRAYKQAAFAVRDSHAALDIVQDAMLKLAEKYGGKPSSELPLLFQRILQNAIRDHFRRQKVRSLWTTLFSSFAPRGEEDDHDPLETLANQADPGRIPEPSEELLRSQTLAAIEQALGELPPRQRQAFVLRYWEDMDVAETARAMGCSEGSVKTHCSRATHALASLLKAKGIEL